MRKTLILMLLAACVAAMSGRTRFSKPTRPPKPDATVSAVGAADTLWQPRADAVGAYGFEKTLRSARESLYVTNNGPDSIVAIGFDVTYFDTAGRMIHRASHHLNPVIPGGETRLLEFPSFDRQGLYYYRLSPAPTRASRATPFDVAVKVNYIVKRNIPANEDSSDSGDGQGAGAPRATD